LDKGTEKYKDLIRHDRETHRKSIVTVCLTITVTSMPLLLPLHKNSTDHWILYTSWISIMSSLIAGLLEPLFIAYYKKAHERRKKSTPATFGVSNGYTLVLYTGSE